MDVSGPHGPGPEDETEPLHAILFREPPPVEALIDVAPLLDAEQLDFAFYLVTHGMLAHQRGIPNERLYARLVGALLLQFTPERRDEQLRETLSLGPPIAALLPESLLPEVLEAAREIDPWYGEPTLAKLAEHLTPEEREPLIERLAAKLRAGEYAESLPDLAPFIDEPLRTELLRQGLQSILALYWEGERLERLRSLAHVLPDSLLPEALEVARATDSAGGRAEALLVLMPRLSRAPLTVAAEEVLAAVPELTHDSTRQIDLLAGLARLRAPEIPVERVIAAARQISAVTYRAMALIRLGTAIDGPRGAELLAEAEQLIREEQLQDSWIGSELQWVPELDSEEGRAHLVRLFGAFAPSRPPLPPGDEIRRLLTALPDDARRDILQGYLRTLLYRYGGAPQAGPPEEFEEAPPEEAGAGVEADEGDGFLYAPAPPPDFDDGDSEDSSESAGEYPPPEQGARGGGRGAGSGYGTGAPPPPRPPPPPSAQPPAAPSAGAPPPPVRAGERPPRGSLKGSARSAPAARTPPRERVVNTGFSPADRPLSPLGGFVPLHPGESYYFWLEVGAPVARSIEATPTPLPVEHLPPEAKLTVALFSPPGSFELDRAADTGELQIRPTGRVSVSRPAAVPDGMSRDDPTLRRRLLFRVRTPNRPGTAYLRCNIYYNSALVQSRLVRARVSRFRVPRPRALSSTVDFTLSRSLSPSHLAGIPPHRLSVMLNRSADGTHSFWLQGDGGVKREAHFEGHELQDLIQFARRAMRRAAWGTDAYWDPERYQYQYEDGQLDLGRLRTDLVRFAVNGYRFHDRIINRLAGGYDESLELWEKMRRPGLVQIANKVHAAHLLPAALLYDHPGLDPDARPLAEYTLCPEFVAALASPQPLEECACFRGDCPSRDAETVVCPSGFWGFRHALGMPLSVEEADEVPTDIVFDGSPSVAVAVSTDPKFSRRAAHEQRLRALRAGLGWAYADTRDEVIRLLGTGQPHLVYFYCHGGVDGNIPYLSVGSLSEGPITRATLRRRVRWTAPRPLVFINGCNTTAVEPEQALDLVSGLVENANAAGVIGTEITIFEPLACDFAEECLRRFLNEGMPIGEAVRLSRLALLKRGNPLGLVYIPFAMASLRLVERAGV